MENNTYNSFGNPTTNGLCIAGMILGILSFFTCGVPALIGLILSIIGVIIAGKKGQKGKGMGIAGIITSAVSLVLLIAFIIFAYVMDGTSYSSGYNTGRNRSSGSVSSSIFDRRSDEDDGIYEVSYGTYEVDEEWEEVDADGQTFIYCLEGTYDGHGDTPNNIMVTHDSNNYDEDEHEEFRDAILADLGEQTQDQNVVITGRGITSDNGYTVYVFEIEGDDVEQVQYYIIGDHEYVMVSAMIWDQAASEDDDIIDVAEDIVDSFEWS